MKKSNSKFQLAPLEKLTNFVNPSSNLLQILQSGDLDTENAYRSRLWFCKIISEAACDKLILPHFPAAN